MAGSNIIKTILALIGTAVVLWCSVHIAIAIAVMSILTNKGFFETAKAIILSNL